MEEKINLLYNFLYNNSFQNCFDIDKVYLGKININDIKITDSKEVNELFDELNEAKFSYMDYDEKENLIYLKRFSDSYPVTVKIGTYQSNINELNNSSNNDSLFSYLLSQLVLYKKTKHILLPIINFDIEFDKIEPLIKSIPIYSKIKEKVEFEEVNKLMSIRIKEHYFKSKLLKEYIEENQCDYKPLLFQVIHTLAVIQKEYPGFRHNNLTIDNILIYIKKEELSENYYEFDKDNWIIPHIGFDIKIFNFEKSTIPNYYEISQRDTNVPYITETNDYFDFHTFINSLIEGSSKMSLKKNNTCNLETIKFLDKVIPTQLRGLKDGTFYLNKNVVVAKPIELLNDPYFKEYKNIKKENSTEIISGNTYYTGMNKVKLDSDNISTLGNQKGYMSRKLKIEKEHFSKEIDNDLVPGLRKLKGGAFFENAHVDKPPVLQTNESKKIIEDDTRQLKPSFDKTYPPKNSSYPPKTYPPKTYPPRDGPYVPKTYPSREGSYPPREGSYPPREGSYPSREGSYPPKDGSYVPKTYPPKDGPYVPKTYPPKEETPYEEKFETNKKFDSGFDEEPEVPPGFVPLYDVNNTMISKMAPYNMVPSQPHINKIYNISLSDPLGNHSLINRVYEDVLPGDQTTYTFLKLNERETIKRFMRNSILDKYDGEEYSIKGGNNSLLSWIKIYDINPYTLKSNPYEDIPTGFLLYRSAYPIRYSKDDNLLKTIPTSMAFNLRIYQLSQGALRGMKMKGLNLDHFDVWRDIKYYQEIDKIIKNKVSPNFINLVLYVIDSKSKVGFDQLEIIKKRKDRSAYNLQTDNDKKINKFALTLEDLVAGKKLDESRKSLAPTYSLSRRVGLSKISNEDELTNTIQTLKKTVEELKKGLTDPTAPTVPLKDDLTISSGKLLVAVTEAPNSNIIKWNSKVYQSSGTVKKMIATGYHKPDVWRSVLFQLLYACAVLEKNKIYFNNFSLENNVFIKDVQTDGTGNSCWLYKIDNIEYYVPNYGYMVVIDSNYADVKEVKDSQQYKIYGDMYKPLNGDMVEDFGGLVRCKIDSLFNHASFAYSDSNELESDVQSILTNIKINNSDSSKPISSSFASCFPEFFNNKIGKLLTKLEKESFNLLSKPDFRVGSLMVRQRRYDEYEWVIYSGEDKGNKKKIHTKEGIKFDNPSVFSSSLFSYPEAVVPDDKQIIETYVF
jgi:hypothetical protein